MRCKQCKKKISAYAKHCPYCGTIVRQQEKQKQGANAYISKTIKKAETNKDYKKRYKRWITAAAFMLAAVLLFVMGCCKNGKEKRFEQDLIFYMKEGALYTKSLKTKETRLVEDVVSASLKDEDSGKIEKMAVYHDKKNHSIYYAAEIYDTPLTCYGLFEKKLGNWKEEAKMLGKNVRMQVEDKNGNLYFVTADTSYLYQYNGKSIKRLQIPFIKKLLYEEESDRLLIITEGSEDISVQEDGMYTEPLNEKWNLSSHGKDIVLVDCGSFTSERKLEGYEGEYCCPDSSKCLYYMKNNQLFELSVKDGAIKKLKDNVESFYMSGNDVLYYISYQLKEKSYYDFAADKNKDRDKNNPKNEEAKTRNQVRKELKQKKMLVFSGSLHAYEEKCDQVICEGVAGFYGINQKIGKEGPFFYADSESFSLYEISETSGEKIIKDMEKVFDETMIKYGNIRGWKTKLYDYTKPSLAIPEQKKVYLFITDEISQYQYEGKRVVSSKDEVTETIQEAKKMEKKIKIGKQIYDLSNMGPIHSWKEVGTEYLLVLEGDGKDQTYTLCAYGVDGKKQEVEDHVSYLIG